MRLQDALCGQIDIRLYPAVVCVGEPPSPLPPYTHIGIKSQDPKEGVRCVVLKQAWSLKTTLKQISFPGLNSLSDPMDCSPPGSSVQGILQARILKWVAIPFSRDLPNPMIEPRFPALQTDSLLTEPPGKPTFLPWSWMIINSSVSQIFPLYSGSKNSLC